MQPDDQELMTLIAQGDRQAFAALFDRYGGRVEGFLRRRLPQTAAVEVAQEVFLRIWRSASRYDAGRASPTTWIFAIARNACTDRARRRARPEPDPDDPMWVPAAPDAPDEAADSRAASSLVRRRVKLLPDGQRRVIELCYLEGKSLPEVAEALAIPLGTVKSRVRLAMGKLRADPELGSLDPDGTRAT